MKTKKTLGDLQKEDGSMTTSNREKAVELNNFFSSLFTDEDTAHIPTLEQREYDTPLCSIEITPAQVRKKLKKLKKTKSAGPDGFHPIILPECVDSITTPLTIIFRKSMEEMKLPSQWKEGHVTPIHKKGIYTSG